MTFSTIEELKKTVKSTFAEKKGERKVIIPIT